MVDKSHSVSSFCITEATYFVLTNVALVLDQLIEVLVMTLKALHEDAKRLGLRCPG